MLGTSRQKTFQQVLGRAQGLADFFGKPAHSVNRLILQIAVDTRPLPEWLRGCTRLSDLPQYAAPSHRHFYVSGFGLTDSELAERIVWTVENITGDWTIAEEGLGFESELDRLHYRMQFG